MPLLKDFHCYICLATFTSIQPIQEHLKTHTSDPKLWKPYGCYFEHCGRAFMNAGDYHRHVFTHTGIRPYTCPVCDLDFNRKANWSRHIKSVHKEILEKYKHETGAESP